MENTFKDRVTSVLPATATNKLARNYDVPKNLPESVESKSNYYWREDVTADLKPMEITKTKHDYSTPKNLPLQSDSENTKSYHWSNGQVAVEVGGIFAQIPTEQYESFKKMFNSRSTVNSRIEHFSHGEEVLEGKNYFEDDDGLEGVVRKDIVNVSNTIIRIVAENKQYDFGDRERVIYDIKLLCSKWKIPLVIQVPKEKFRMTYSIAKKEHPEITCFTNGTSDILEEYFADIAAHEVENRKIYYSYAKTGWREINGRIEYKLGDNPIYENWIIPTPILVPEKMKEVFSNGLSFLNLSDEKMVVNSIFIFAHIGFLKYWTRLANFNIASVLFIKGTTGSFKTTVSSEIFNVFQPNKSQRYIQFSGSTWAGVSKCLLAAQDNTIIIDDFSKTEVVNAKEATNLMEKILRAVGDEQLSTKLEVGGKNLQNAVIRTSVVVTGEESPNLGLSSNLRIITVPVERGTFSKENLTAFQKNRDIMPNYFSLFIQFLTEFGKSYINHVVNNIDDYRREFSNKFSEPRFLEMAVLLKLTADVIYQFGKYCGVDIASVYNSFLEEINNLVAYNEASIVEEQPHIKILKPLYAMLNNESNAIIAKNEILFNEDPTRFVGFYEEQTNTIWLDFNKVINLITVYWKKRGATWLISDKRVKEILDQKGLILKDSDGFLKRAKKGNRKRYLVIKIDKMEEVLKGVE